MTPYHRIILLPIPVGRTPGRVSYNVFHRRESHELTTAQTLLRFGYNLQFLKASPITGQTTPDCTWCGHNWEIKTLKGNSANNALRAFIAATKQSRYIIIDTTRSPRTTIQAARDIMNYCHERSGCIAVEQVMVLDHDYYCVLTRDMLK